MRISLALALLSLAALAADRSWRSLDRADGLPNDDVRGLCAEGPERVWAATAAGLCRIERHSIQPAGPQGSPRQVIPAAGGGIYALYPDGIARVQEGGHEWIELPFEPAQTPGARLVPSGPAGVLVVTRERAFRLPPGGTWTETERPDIDPDRPRPPFAAPVPIVDWIEHRGEIWAATRSRGILRRRLRPRFRAHALPGAAHVNALAAARDGSIWCGTERGLALVTPEGVRSVPTVDGKELGAVTACAVDRDGRLWIGSGSAFTGVYRLDRDRWRHLDTIPAFVHRITLDATGSLWFAVLSVEGGGQGAWYFKEDGFHPAPAVASLAAGRVYDVVARDPSGVLWFGTLKGLAAYEGTGRLTHLTPQNSDLRGEKVWCLEPARDGSLWIGYQAERGASRLVRGEFRHYDVEDGLCDGKVWSITEGRPGEIWFATAGGLSRFDGRRWSCFRNEEGLGGEPIWPLLPRPDGSVWIGTLGGGLVHLVPDDDEGPRTRFLATRYEGTAGRPVTVSWSGADAWFDTPARRLWYRWRLDDGRWSKAAPRTNAVLDPPAGRYRLQVQAIDRFGNVEWPPAEVPLRVRGSSRLSWLLAVCAAALLALSGGFLLGRRARREA
jgi:sugar lactone lactonase YvrE